MTIASRYCGAWGLVRDDLVAGHARASFSSRALCLDDGLSDLRCGLAWTPVLSDSLHAIRLSTIHSDRYIITLTQRRERD